MVQPAMERKAREIRGNMIVLKDHHIARLEEIASVTKEPVAEVLTRAFCDLGTDTTLGAFVAWLWQERISLGLDSLAHFRDEPERVAKWQRIEDDDDHWPRFNLLDEEEATP